MTYDLNGFKSRINRHLLTAGSFSYAYIIYNIYAFYHLYVNLVWFTHTDALKFPLTEHIFIMN